MMNKPDIKQAAIFLYYWTCSGFFMGTLTLMGPVRWATNYSRSAGWSYQAEKVMVLGFIGLLFLISLSAARFLSRLHAETPVKALKIGLLTGTAALFLISLGFWMNPKLMIDSGAKTTEESFSGAEFVFGPYPEKDRLVSLKAEGYTAVISLLSPAVVPFEPVLLAREQQGARETGVELIHIPMLPWISSNDHVKAELEKIKLRGQGKYYVHCYLGKDRVNVFKNMLSSSLGEAKVTSMDPANIRRVSDRKSFERGKITRLAEDVYFTPYPTDHEFFAYILNGTVKSLVSLLNPGNPKDVQWIEKEKDMAAKYGIRLVNFPWKTLDEPARAKAVREIRKLEKPMVIHAFLSHTPESLEFISAYKAGGVAAKAAQPASAGK